MVKPALCLVLPRLGPLIWRVVPASTSTDTFLFSKTFAVVFTLTPIPLWLLPERLTSTGTLKFNKLIKRFRKTQGSYFCCELIFLLPLKSFQFCSLKANSQLVALRAASRLFISIRSFDHEEVSDGRKGDRLSYFETFRDTDPSSV